MSRSFQFAAALAALASSPVVAQSPGAAASPRPAATADAQALAHTIVDTAFPPERRNEMMDKLMRTMGDQMKSALPSTLMSDPGLARIMTDYLAQIPTTLRPATTAFIPKQMDAVAQAYARMFTVAELRDIVTFARTPSGRNYLQRSVDVMSDPAVAAVNSQYFAQAQTLTQASAGALGEKVSAYLKAHPDAAKSLQAQSGRASPD
jgi:hypothetical protein